MHAILFDIGKVIVDFDFQVSARKIAPLCSLPSVQILEVLTPHMVELESGQISRDQFLDLATKMIGFDGERQFLVDAFQDVFDLNEPMVELIEAEYARGTDLCLLSNTNGIHAPFLFENYAVFGRFRGAVLSHEVKCMKPEPEIFDKTIDALDLDPGRTIYIDDRPENCEAGKAKGFHSICYDLKEHECFLENYRELSDRLAAY